MGALIVLVVVLAFGAGLYAYFRTLYSLPSVKRLRNLDRYYDSYTHTWRLKSARGGGVTTKPPPARRPPPDKPAT